MEQMQDTAQLWEQLLYIPGGKLELSKCFYYPIIWSFDSEGAALLKSPNQLNLRRCSIAPVSKITTTTLFTSYRLEDTDSSVESMPTRMGINCVGYE
jgi:hypothetical protein